MYYNPGYPSDIVAITPEGTNSTMFTECCHVAICNDEVGCPVCHQEVIGDNAENSYKRGRIRWANATRFWNRRTNESNR